MGTKYVEGMGGGRACVVAWIQDIPEPFEAE